MMVRSRGGAARRRARDAVARNQGPSPESWAVKDHSPHFFEGYAAHQEACSSDLRGAFL